MGSIIKVVIGELETEKKKLESAIPNIILLWCPIWDESEFKFYNKSHRIKYKNKK